MKKLIIAAAIAAVALVSNASAFNWSNTGVSTTGVIYNYQANSTKLYSSTVSYTAYLICAGDTTQADLLTALRKGDALSDYAIGGNSTTTLNSSSKIAKTSDFDYGSAGNSYNFYFAILDAANDQVLISDVSAGLAQESGTTAVAFSGSKTWSNQAFGEEAFSSAGWYSTVPEPTSGLLLLLGMAGLALRRKQK